MTTIAPAPQMTEEERAATVAFHADLVAQFKDNAERMWAARGREDLDTYEATVEEARTLYREIAEVEHVLTTGVLPF